MKHHDARAIRRREARPTECEDCHGPLVITSPTVYSKRCEACRRKRKADRARVDYWRKHDTALQIAERYRRANRSVMRARTNDWRQRMGESLLVIRREAYAADPEPHRERSRVSGHARRKQMQKSVGVSVEDWREILRTFDHRCGYCFASGELTLEHVRPLSRGGLHEPDNVIPACKRCNFSKGAKLLTEWAGPPREDAIKCLP